jgi:septal ring factor EnvC (AmiA/AmiB activator)
MPEQPPKVTHSYPEILQLNQELVRSLQGLSDEDESRKKALEQLKVAYDQAKAEIARLQEELRRSQEREAERQQELRQLEQERVDQLAALDAHLNAMHSAVERYLQQGRKAA